MRCLDSWTGQFAELDPKETNDAILSHTWRKREQTYCGLKALHAYHREVLGDDCISRNSSPNSSRPVSPSPDTSSVFVEAEHPIGNDPKLSRKIRQACRIAREAGYRYLWIDSCFIDKMSSAELSEAINSMYEWCSLSKVCYVYLADVPPDRDPREDVSAFRENR